MLKIFATYKGKRYTGTYDPSNSSFIIKNVGEFSTSSAAAREVCGSGRNGRTFWSYEDEDGKTQELGLLLNAGKVEKIETRGRSKRGEEKCISKSISLTPQEFEDMQSKAKFMGFKDLSSYLRFTHEFFTKHAMDEFNKAE